MNLASAFQARRLAAPVTLTVAALCWCAAAAAPAMLPGFGWPAGAAVLRAAFSLVCHQDPARSFHLEGSPLAVCIRCTGIYAGFVLGCIAVLAARSWGRVDGAPRGRLLAACMAPTAIEWLAELAGLPDPTGLARLTTGALFGFAAAFYVVHAAEELPAEMAAELHRLTSPARSAHGKAS